MNTTEELLTGLLDTVRGFTNTADALLVAMTGDDARLVQWLLVGLRIESARVRFKVDDFHEVC